MSRGDGIEVLAGGQAVLGPVGLVPTPADDPLAWGRVPRPYGDARFHLRKRGCTGQVEVEFEKAGCGEMHVGIVESRHDEVPAQIDYLGVRVLQFLDLLVGADGQHPPAPNRYGFGHRGSGK